MTDSKDDLFSGLESFLQQSDAGDIFINDDKTANPNAETAEDDQDEPTEKKPKATATTDDGLIEVNTDANTSTDNGQGDDTTDDETGDSDESYKPIAAFLKNEGILPGLDLDEFDGSVDALKKGFEDELNEWKQGYLDSLPPVLKELAEKYEEGVPFDELLEIKSNQIRYNSITDDDLKEDISAQKMVMKQLYKNTTRWDDKRIEKEIARLETIGELEGESLDGIKELRTFEAKKEKEVEIRTKQEQKEAEKRAAEFGQKLKTTVNEVKEIIPGVRVADKERKAILESMTVPVGYDDHGNPISRVMALKAKDPIGFETKLAYFVEKGFFEGKFDAVINTAKTKAMQEVERHADAGKTLKGGKDTIGKDQDSEALLKQFASFAKKKK
jgi:hypothetical protein